MKKQKDNLVESEDAMEEAINDLANDSFMLKKAERHIQKLECELKEKEFAIGEHIRRWQFYEQIVKNLTTFK